MMEAVEPRTNTMDLIDLIPETFYQLEVRDNSGANNNLILARITFTTSGKPLLCYKHTILRIFANFSRKISRLLFLANEQVRPYYPQRKGLHLCILILRQSVKRLSIFLS